MDEFLNSNQIKIQEMESKLNQFEAKWKQAMDKLEDLKKSFTSKKVEAIEDEKLASGFLSQANQLEEEREVLRQIYKELKTLIKEGAGQICGEIDFSQAV
jgi:hypothetical protein